MTKDWPDLAVLELLVAVAERGSVGAAARKVGVAQPNASRSLARLERRLGIELLERGPRGSTLTSAGGVVVDWARSTLAAAEHLVLGADALRAGLHAQLRVGASMTVAEYLMPAWLGELRRLHPGVRLGLEVHNSADIIERLEAGTLDIGFVETPQVPTHLATEIVAHDRLEVVVHPAHPWAGRREPLAPEELASTPLVLRELGSGTRDVLVEALAGHVVAAPAMELGSNAAVRVSAAAGVAPAVLSGLAVAEALRTGELRRVPAAVPLDRQLRAVWRPRSRVLGPAGELVRIARRSSVG